MQINLHNVSRHEVHVYFRRVEGTKPEEIAAIPVAGSVTIYPRDEGERLMMVKDLEAAGGFEGRGEIDMNGLCPFLYNFDEDKNEDLIVEAGQTNLDTEKMIAADELAAVSEIDVAMPDGQTVALDLGVEQDQNRARRGRPAKGR